MTSLAVHTSVEEAAWEAAVNEELEDFDRWFQALGNAPLVRSEKAIVKTYLWKKLKETRDAQGCG